MNENLEEVLKEISDEIERQEKIWGTQGNVPDDRWMEIVDDEFKDLKWAVRTRSEVERHTIKDERLQTITTLIRWHLTNKEKST